MNLFSPEILQKKNSTNTEAYNLKVMSANCQLVVFSNKAYNALIRESFDKNPVETGGILLGHILDNGIWIVMEVLPPGINSIFEYAYFEYDDNFVNYLAQSVANQYKKPLDLLGLWHRHPGSMDVFSSTDDGTNMTFARQNPKGVISGLVNIDPRFRLTMYHMDRPIGRLVGRPDYDVVEVEVGDDIIPEEYFELRYFNGEEDKLHPTVHREERPMERSVHSSTAQQRRTVDSGEIPSAGSMDVKGIIDNQLSQETSHPATPKVVDDFFFFWRTSKRKWLYTLCAVVIVILFAFSVKSCKDSISGVSSWISNILSKDNDDEISSESSKEEITLGVGEKRTIELPTDLKKIEDDITWESKNSDVASVKRGQIKGNGKGQTEILAYVKGEVVKTWTITVEETASETILILHNSEVTLCEGDNSEPIISSDTRGVEFTSLNPEIASVSSEGIISALRKGETKIIAVKDDKTAICHVTVVNSEKQEETQLKISGTHSGSLKVGQQWKLTISVPVESGISFVSSADSIASIDNNGNVKALKAGKTILTLRKDNKVVDQYELTVKP